MSLKRELEENPFAAPLDEDWLKTAWQYRDRFEEEAEFQDALELWPRCPRCGKRRVTRCPVCKTSGDLFALADQEYYDYDAKPLEPPSRSVCPSCSHRGEHATHNCRGTDDDDAFDVEVVETEEERAQRRLKRRHVWATLGRKSECGQDEAASSERPPALLCHVCSEAFTPVFPRVCEWCDYDFGEGEEYEVDGSISKDVADFLERKAREEDAAFEPNSSRVLWTVVALTLALVAFLIYTLFVF